MEKICPNCGKRFTCEGLAPSCKKAKCLCLECSLKTDDLTKRQLNLLMKLCKVKDLPWTIS